MDESLAEVQQAIAATTSPAAEFQQLTRSRQRNVFFLLPESVQRTLVEDLVVGIDHRYSYTCQQTNRR